MKNCKINTLISWFVYALCARDSDGVMKEFLFRFFFCSPF